MSIETRLIAGLAVLFVSLALVSMLAAHERHYKERRYRIFAARLDALEAILTEDRRA